MRYLVTKGYYCLGSPASWGSTRQKSELACLETGKDIQMNIAVIGATGMVGERTVAEAVARGHQVDA